MRRKKREYFAFGDFIRGLIFVAVLVGWVVFALDDVGYLSKMFRTRKIIKDAPVEIKSAE